MAFLGFLDLVANEVVGIMACLGFLILVAAAAAGILCVLIKQMDKALNFSMKKKIRVKWIPLYFPNDRKNESKLGKTLEDPNEGVYLPAFICSLVVYFIVILAVIYIILVYTIEIPKDKIMWGIYGILLLIIVHGCIVDALLNHYKYKYYMHQEEWKVKILKKLEERENSIK